MLYQLLISKATYSKCSKISNNFPFLFRTKIRTGINKMLVRIANKDDPDQTVFNLGNFKGGHFHLISYGNKTQPNISPFT